MKLCRWIDQAPVQIAASELRVVGGFGVDRTGEVLSELLKYIHREDIGVLHIDVIPTTEGDQVWLAGARAKPLKLLLEVDSENSIPLVAGLLRYNVASGKRTGLKLTCNYDSNL